MYDLYINGEWHRNFELLTELLSWIQYELIEEGGFAYDENGGLIFNSIEIKRN